MVTLSKNNYTIQIFEEDNYHLKAEDNKYNYNNSIFIKTDYNQSHIGIRAFQYGEEINSCVLFGNGLGGLVFEDSLLVHENQIIICCSNYLCAISLDTFELKWKSEVDPDSAWHIYQLEDDYLVHGELQISRITKDGDIKWQFRGDDIFFSLEGTEECKIENDSILLTDFEEKKYVLNFDGQEVDPE